MTNNMLGASLGIDNNTCQTTAQCLTDCLNTNQYIGTAVYLYADDQICDMEIQRTKPIDYETPKPKSGRPVYRTFDWGWIVVAYETGPLKLLETERK